LLKRAHLIEHKQLVAIALHLEEIAFVLPLTAAPNRATLPAQGLPLITADLKSATCFPIRTSAALRSAYIRRAIWSINTSAWLFKAARCCGANLSSYLPVLSWAFAVIGFWSTNIETAENQTF
jgi:hypothetical protein